MIQGPLSSGRGPDLPRLGRSTGWERGWPGSEEVGKGTVGESRRPFCADDFQAASLPRCRRTQGCVCEPSGGRGYQQLLMSAKLSAEKDGISGIGFPHCLAPSCHHFLLCSSVGAAAGSREETRLNTLRLVANIYTGDDFHFSL